MKTIHIQHDVATHVQSSARVLEIASMFGLNVDDTARQQIVPPCAIPLPPGGIVFITGPSGGGKTSILSCIARGLSAHSVIRLDRPDEPERTPLVDLFDRPLEEAVSRLARVGLGEAFVMLRSPDQLSDGQRARLALARVIDLADRRGDPVVILADEFLATLDRLTATLICRNLRHWIAGTGHTFIAATTHDDLLEALQPEVLVHAPLGDAVEVVTRASSASARVEATP